MAAYRAEFSRTKGDIKKWRSLPSHVYDPYPGIGEAIAKIDVHGGLTYADEKDGDWFFGFDCAHLGDLCPQMNALLHRIHIDQGDTRGWDEHKALFKNNVYRTVDYVRDECADLAQQLKALERSIDVQIGQKTDRSSS
jgi:hypothetical protein